MTGTVIPVADCPDAVFSDKILGDGIAILPTDGRVYAPVDGKVLQVSHTLHAFCIASDDGLELLIHLGMDTVVSRLPKLGKQICYVLSHLIMLFCVILFATGSWEQTLINIGVEAAATGISSGFFYGVGLFFCAPAAFILLYDLYRMLSGQLQEKELIRVKESQEELDESEIQELQEEMERESKKLASTSKGGKQS